MNDERKTENKESKSVNKKPSNWFYKKYIALKNQYDRFRKWLEKKREKNPQFFDWLTHVLTGLWMFFSICLTGLLQYKIVVMILMLISYIFLLTFQWAIGANKRDRMIAERERKWHEERKLIKDQNESDIEQIKEYSEDTICFTHAVAHQIKMQISQMPHQRMAVVRSQLTNFLAESMNMLEHILSEYYNQKICASIKLCVKDNKVKTYARGQNNIENRGGISKVKNLNKKEIAISENYAYTAIIEHQLQYFAEGNLLALSVKENDEDLFFCEYGEKWSEMFKASIIIPIRYPIFNNNKGEYKVLGLLCIDAKEEEKTWSKASKSYAYQLSAFFADAVYNLIAQYVKKQYKSEVYNK